MRMTSTEQVPLSKLKTFPGNPKRGDVQAIKSSLRANGQFRAIVVRRKGMHVLAGNHTFMAARELGWDTMLCHIVTCTDAEARRIVAADNGTNKGVYDDSALAELLGQISEDGGLEGTGYDADFLADLIAEPSAEPVALIETFEIIVTCTSEKHQRDLLGRFEKEGLECRALL